MTRDEFIEQVVTIDGLIEFCNEYGFENYIEGVIHCSGLNECVTDDITELIRYNGWKWNDIRNSLDDIPEGEEYYRREGCLEYSSFDEYDRDCVAEELFEWLDDSEWFDEEEEHPEEQSEEQHEEMIQEDPEPELDVEIDFEAIEREAADALDAMAQAEAMLADVTEEANKCLMEMAEAKEEEMRAVEEEERKEFCVKFTDFFDGMFI